MLTCDELETREMPAVAAIVAGGTLTVTGTAASDRITVYQSGPDLVVLDGTREAFRTSSAAVTNIAIDGGGGNDSIRIAPSVTQPAMIDGGSGNNKLVAGAGDAVLVGGTGNDALFGGLARNTFNADGGANALFKVRPGDVVFPNPGDAILREADPNGASMLPQTLSTADVNALLERAAAASASTDAIIAVVDRNGTILGVRVESGVDPAITGNNEKLVFAVDGAVSLALTGAYFANAGAPLTSRTVQFISQSTITQREVDSDPNIPDLSSTVRGPGFVAPINPAGHFPPGIALTPQVDLFGIEHTNRDSTVNPGPDHIKGTPDDVKLLDRFNIDPAFVPAGNALVSPDSYGFVSNLVPNAQSRGIATLPGGIPIYKYGQVVGGIGVFFPGKTGYATEENSSLSFGYNPAKLDRTLEAEWMAYAAVGGTTVSVTTGIEPVPIGTVGGIPVPAGFGLPTGRIDLVGITLDIFGQGGTDGIVRVLAVGAAVGRGNPDDGVDLPVNTGGATLLAGKVVPEGWLVLPHDGDGITKEDVETIITQSIEQSNLTRAAIRLPLGTRAKFVFAVTDKEGNVVGLYREPDATVFSIDVAVAKARNVMYYADPSQLQPIDQIAGVPAGTAFTNRTFRYVSLPHFPEGIDFAPPGPFSQLNDDPLGTNRATGLLVGNPLPASAYQSVYGHDAFNPDTNFHDPNNILNQNGIVFFPGSAPLYRPQVPGGPALLSGGFGVSGDGVDQDDVTTIAGQIGFNVPPNIPRSDQIYVNGIHLPYQKTNRNPEG
jgi:uncharacterized protein GlcG (DUF336 family)